jgi:S1-C subfamily serine protease
VHVGASAFLGVRVSSSGFPGLGSFGNGGGSGSSGTTSGIAIGDVVSGQAAEKAGLGAGDVITSIDGRSISTSDELSKLMLAHHPGDTVEVHWTDAAGASHSASVQLGSGPPA